MSLKIAKFINKHLKVYIQEYNHVLKQQWLFLKYHDALLVLKHPIKYFKKPTANHVCCHCSMQCFINIAEKWHIVKPGMVEQQKMEYQNTKSGMVKHGYRISNLGQTIKCQSHVNKLRVADSSVPSQTSNKECFENKHV